MPLCREPPLEVFVVTVGIVVFAGVVVGLSGVVFVVAFDFESAKCPIGILAPL